MEIIYTLSTETRSLYNNFLQSALSYYCSLVLLLRKAEKSKHSHLYISQQKKVMQTCFTGSTCIPKNLSKQTSADLCVHGSQPMVNSWETPSVLRLLDTRALSSEMVYMYTSASEISDKDDYIEGKGGESG